MRSRSCVALLAFLLAPLAVAQDAAMAPHAFSGRATKPVVSSAHDMVAAADPLAVGAMASTIVYDGGGRIVMVVGATGGGAIVNYVAKTLIGLLDWGLDPQASIDLPNIGSRNGPTELEEGTSVVALEPKLRALGHETHVVEQNSGLHAIVCTKTGWMGGADPRREGTVKGD